MNTPPLTVGTLRQLLTIIMCCPRIEHLEKLPDATDLQEHLRWRKPNYRVAFDLFDKRYPNEKDADKWRKLQQGYSIAYSNFDEEFEQRIDSLTTDRASRLAYLKRSFDNLYSGPSRYQWQDEVASYLRSDKFKNLKTHIDADLWDELDEMGCALWQSAVYGKCIDYMLERAFQIEGEPIKHGWLWKEQEQENTESDPAPATSTAPAPDEQQQPGFDSYINEQKRDKLMPYLVQHYTNKKPKEIVPMLYALETLGALMCKVSECDQTNLHNALTTTFGNVGVRTSLNSALPLYHRDGINGTKRQKLEQHKQQIENFLKAK